MKLKTKLLFAYQSIAIILLVVVSIFFSVLFFNEKISTSQDQVAERMMLVNMMITNTQLDQNLSIPENINELFEESHWIEMGLFSMNPSRILLKTKNFPIADLADLKPDKLSETLRGGEILESLQMDSGSKDIWGYTVVKNKNLIVVGFVPSNKTYRILYLFGLKLLIIALLSIGLVSIFAQFFATKLTNYISYIKNQIVSFGSGNLDSRVTKITSDELGEIAGNFNTMAQKITDLVHSEADRARLEQEIITAQRVQKFFFSPLSFVGERVQIHGHYEAADICGGDWWFYHELHDRMYILIGDVTGHGTPSAMLTSSCRSVFANVFNHNRNSEPNEILRDMSHAIYQTVQGDLNMTMCIVCYHYDTKMLYFSNASHEMPYFWPLLKGDMKRKDIQILAETHGPRLGQSEHVEYGISAVKIERPIRLLLYSDGLSEMNITAGGILGERNLIKTVISTQNSLKIGGTADLFYQSFNSVILEHRGDARLSDDISYLIVDITG